MRNEQQMAHLDGQPADLSTFRRCWNHELPWIRIASSDARLEVTEQFFLCEHVIQITGPWPTPWPLSGSNVYSLLGLHISEKPPWQNATWRNGNLGRSPETFRTDPNSLGLLAGIILKLFLDMCDAFQDNITPFRQRRDWRLQGARNFADGRAMIGNLPFEPWCQTCVCCVGLGLGLAKVLVHWQMWSEQDDVAVRSWHVPYLQSHVPPRS